jgi:hypothetical protein
VTPLAKAAAAWRPKFCRFELALSDFWIGVFWRRDKTCPIAHDPFTELRSLDVWICVLPCVPLHLRWERMVDVMDEWDREAERAAAKGAR